MKCNINHITEKYPDGKFPDERKIFHVFDFNFQTKNNNIEFIFQADESWRVPTGDDCWEFCNQKSGKCDFCGTVGVGL